MTYKVDFVLDPARPDQLMALYIKRACSNAEVLLNGNLIGRGGPMMPPVSRNCYYPQLTTLPTSLLDPSGRNRLEIHVAGDPLEEVAARQRSGGLSELVVGPQSELRMRHDEDLFWNVTLSLVTGATIAVLGVFMLAVAWVRRSEPAYLYFGVMLIGWTLIGTRVWVRDLPVDHWVFEAMISCLYPPVVACAVLFLQRYGGRRHRGIEAAMVLQCFLVPATILLGGPGRFFQVVTSWSTLYVLEVAWAAAHFLRVAWVSRRREFWAMAAALAVILMVAGVEVMVQHDVLGLPRLHLMQFAMPVLFFALGLRLVQQFVEAVQAAEAARAHLEQRVLERATEIERSYAHLAELRIEQVAEAERKRIAGDLHDDLGAKLLTIVHTSNDDRIATLAREALEEMRLSVRGLTGKPVKIADALADWRAETVSRLSQSAVQVDWTSTHENDERHLSARAFVQTTRILREATSNIIKHSGANACSIRCVIDDTDFNLVIQDNGRGIPMELDGKLDRGHGMASMKRRAKQLAGQCLVESGPGYGTVIRLTLPL